LLLTRNLLTSDLGGWDKDWGLGKNGQNGGREA